MAAARLVSTLILFAMATVGIAAAEGEAKVEPGIGKSQQQQLDLVVGDYDVEVTRFAADGRYLLLWLAPGFGGREQHQRLAASLANAGMALWLVDLLEAQFLPRDRNAQLRIDPELVADLISRAARHSRKPVVLMGVGGSAAPVLRGAEAWLRRGGDGRELAGAVLLAPSLYRSVPELGQPPDYLPIVSANRLPVAVLQPGNRVGSQRLDALVDALSSQGAPIYAQRLPGVSSLFAARSRAEQAPNGLAGPAGLAKRISWVLPLLAASAPAESAQLAPLAAPAERPPLDTELRPFRGQPLAPTILLADTHGEQWRVDGYQGQVTVINFWASWCPPCVKEIPALNRMQQDMKAEPFRLISIDLGESPATVQAFLQRVAVDFPVLLDSDGAVAAAWKVIGLPSTFIVGPDGRIQLGANGAIGWDAPELIEQLKSLARSPEK